MEAALSTLELNNVKDSQMKFMNPFVTWAKEWKEVGLKLLETLTPWMN